MEIKNFGELNALCKLLRTIKFSEKLTERDLDIFAGSPLIAAIHERAAKAMHEEAVKQKMIPETWTDAFLWDSRDGRAVRNRIDNWNDGTIRIARNWSEDILNNYIKTTLAPLEYSEDDFDRVKNYILNKIKH